MNHVIEPTQLQIGDHIYRQLSFWIMDVYFLQHHGIVTYVPTVNPNKNNIKVLEMAKNSEFKGIQEVTLEKFLAGRKLRIVKYGVSLAYQKSHLTGTCHTEPKSDPKKIIKRCNQLKELFANINNTYSLFGLNCEHFALFCATGIMHHGIKSTQLLGLLRKAEDGAHCAHKIRAVNRTTGVVTYHTPQPLMPNKPLPKCSATMNNSAAKSSAKSSAKMSAKSAMPSHGHHVSHSAFTTIPSHVIGTFVGIAAGMELCATGYKIYKYKYDPTYFKEDLKWELIHGWTVTGSIIGVGLIGISLSIGWWIVPPLFVSTVIVHLVLHKIHKPKTYKEKCYIERGLQLDSSIIDKQEEIAIIEKEIEHLKVSVSGKKFNIEYIEMISLQPENILSDVRVHVAKANTSLWKQICNICESLYDSWLVYWTKHIQSAKVMWLINVKEFLQEDVDKELEDNYAIFNAINVSMDIKQTTVEMSVFKCYLDEESERDYDVALICGEMTVEMAILMD